MKMKCDKYEVGGDRDDDGGVEWRDCDPVKRLHPSLMEVPG